MSRVPCPSCGSSNVFTYDKPISAGGGYSPNLLPGLGGFFGGAKVEVVVCADCGLLRQFASEEARQKLRGGAKRWTRER